MCSGKTVIEGKNMTPNELAEVVEGLEIGERISIRNIPEEQYHRAPGLGSTVLKAATRSLAHYRVAVMDEAQRSAQARKAMAIGSATHCLVLEAEKYGEKFVVQPDDIKVRNGKRWEEFQSQHLDKEILTAADEQLASAMADAVLDDAGKFFMGGEPELSYWYRHTNGLLLKARIDYQIGDAGVDLKSAHAEDERKFALAVKYDYDIQDASYRLVSGLADLIFVGVSKEPPHAIYLCKQGQQVRQRAERALERALDALAVAREFDDYPKPPAHLVETFLTPYELEHAE